MDKEQYNLKRFIDAQKQMYQQALAEIKNGRKVTHWIWYVFPQLKGLGHSYNAKYYALSDVNEACAYLSDNVLGSRLREISEALLNQSMEHSVRQILGSIDTMKVKSCMTLFDYISPNDVFSLVLDKYYDGKKCAYTLKKCNQQENPEIVKD